MHNQSPKRTRDTEQTPIKGSPTKRTKTNGHGLDLEQREPSNKTDSTLHSVVRFNSSQGLASQDLSGLETPRQTSTPDDSQAQDIQTPRTKAIHTRSDELDQRMESFMSLFDLFDPKKLAQPDGIETLKTYFKAMFDQLITAVIKERCEDYLKATLVGVSGAVASAVKTTKAQEKEQAPFNLKAIPALIRCIAVTNHLLKTIKDPVMKPLVVALKDQHMEALKAAGIRSSDLQSRADLIRAAFGDEFEDVTDNLSEITDISYQNSLGSSND